MSIEDKCGNKIFEVYLKPKEKFVVLYDFAHKGIATGIQKSAEQNGFSTISLEINDDTIENTFGTCIAQNRETILLVDEISFNNYKLFRFLDLSRGTPHIANLNKKSYVSVLPIDSAYRIYSSSFEADAMAREDILGRVKNNFLHKITTRLGTNLSFISRNWIIQDNEVLTAPIENSINGVIAVDGAVFFKKIDSVIFLKIENGFIVDLQAKTEQAKKIVNDYLAMTKHVFSTNINKQLAEVGIGYNTNASISNCFMESEMVYNTCHFCFGNNICYRGENKSDFHGASVLIKNPEFHF